MSDRDQDLRRQGTPTRANAATSPHPLDRRWYAHVDGKTYGPFSGHEIRAMVEKGQIVDSDFLCPEGGTEWVLAKNERVLGALFRPRPQAAPGQPAAIATGSDRTAARRASDGTNGNAARGQAGARARRVSAAVSSDNVMGSFWHAILAGYSSYVNFSGRSARSDYWYFVLFTVIASVVTEILDVELFWRYGFSPLSNIFELGTFLPSLAISARRLHDIDRTGWWVLIGATGIGFFVLLFWACQKGTEGPNSYGPDPLSGVGGEVSPRLAT